MTEAKYTASDIAKWFLYYNNLQMEEADADPITNLKLQKLLYYAQGCYLALKGTPLFDDDIEAWEHGPVVPSVYQEYKGDKGNGIPYRGDYDVDIDPEDEAVLIEVYEIFGKYSAWGLRNMTHSETPWLSTERNQVIGKDVIKEYFQENYIDN